VRGVLARDTLDADGTAASMYDGAILDFQIVAAQAIVDGYLAGRYMVPFVDGAVPPLVTALTVDLAAYRATLTYRQSVDLGVDDPVRLRYTDCMAMLKAIAAGDMDLPATPAPGGGTTPGTSGTVSVRNPYLGRLFGTEDFELGTTGPRRGGWLGGW
jgi:phage gp36-like protein